MLHMIDAWLLRHGRQLPALLLLICFPDPGAAWTRTGHSAVVEIATRHLSQRASDQIRSLLGSGPKGLADLAMWADDIAEERPETDFWHMVEIPHESEGYDRTRDCPKDNCLVERINDFARQLVDHRLAPAVRAEALKFLIHLVGDLHVPFHAYAPGPPHDLWRGWGSSDGPWIRADDNVTQLHIWFEWVLVAALGPNARAIADRLADQITAADRVTWQRGAVADWANESFALARQFVINYGLNDPILLAENSKDSPLVLPDQARVEGMAIVADRLKMAGVRLAWLLNRTLD